jgi:hypothetical protein
MREKMSFFPLVIQGLTATGTNPRLTASRFFLDTLREVEWPRLSFRSAHGCLPLEL